jgi:Legionella pneumophila major outer membrane protein precursor
MALLRTKLAGVLAVLVWCSGAAALAQGTLPGVYPNGANPSGVSYGVSSYGAASSGAPAACTPAGGPAALVLAPTTNQDSLSFIQLVGESVPAPAPAPAMNSNAWVAANVDPSGNPGFDPNYGPGVGPGVGPMVEPAMETGGDPGIVPMAGPACGCCSVPQGACCNGHWTFGGDYLFVRPHFSEATAFARGNDSINDLHVTAQDLDFQYSSSFRVFAGYCFEGTDTELRFTYTRMTGHTEEDAGNFAAGHFAVDPFGDIAGTAVVVDPNSFRQGQTIVGGDHIAATADVAVNIFDLDLIKPILWVCGGCEFRYSAGVRFAQVSQDYQSVINENGSYFSGGVYTAQFNGAGPRLGFQAERYFGRCRQFSVFANAAGSLLVGEYDARFVQVTPQFGFNASQETDTIRVLPVAEAEIGTAWSPTPWLKLSCGWLFQTWFDLGASGGSFGGFYNVTDNSNIMAFEGAFARTQITF